MSTHTCAVLDVSPAAFAEIRDRLQAAGYEHAFDRVDGKVVMIDMQGIGLIEAASTSTTECNPMPPKPADPTTWPRR